MAQGRRRIPLKFAQIIGTKAPNKWTESHYKLVILLHHVFVVFLSLSHLDTTLRNAALSQFSGIKQAIPREKIDMPSDNA